MFQVHVGDRVDQNLLSIVDPTTGHRKPIVATDTPNAFLPNKPPTSSVPLVNTVPPRGEASLPNYHVVPLDSDIGQTVIRNQTRGEDEHRNPKHHVTHQGMLTKYPALVVQHLWDVTKGMAGYVAWSYADFYNHFVTWKGSYVEMLTDVKFMWRALVTGLLTVTLIEIMPLIEGLSRLLWDIFWVLRQAFGLVERAAEELFRFLEIVWEDTESLFRRFW